MNIWAVPWTPDQAIDFAFLLVSTVAVAGVPLLYGMKANLRDPLARSVLAGTGATAVVFVASTIFTLALHTGWHPPDSAVHWIARGLYLTVAAGKAILLFSILRLIRSTNKQRIEYGLPSDESSGQ